MCREAKEDDAFIAFMIDKWNEEGRENLLFEKPVASWAVDMQVIW